MTPTMLETMPDTYRRFQRFMDALARLFMQRNLFPAGYPSVRRALEETERALDDLAGGARPVTLRNGGGCLCYLNFKIDFASVTSNEFHFFRKAIDMLAVSEIEFNAQVARDEFLAFAEIASAVVRRDRTFDISSAWMRISGIKIRRVSTAAAKEATAAAEEAALRPVAPPRRGAIRSESGAGDLLSGVLRNLDRIDSSEGKKAGRLVLDLVEHEGRNDTMVLLLKSLKAYDEYTFDHSVNVAVISTAIAGRLGYGVDEAGAVSMAALMHDIGKIYVPRGIIHKAGQLTPREWQYVKRHPIDGERILREEGADYLTRRVAYEHHMRYDLKGYPLPKEGERALEVSHIVRIADSYDALTTKRSYRKQINPFQAIHMMEGGRAREFHPGYFDLFLQVLGNFPIGSVLILEDGIQALVVEVGEGGRLPRVRLLTDASGNAIDDKALIDLAEIDPATGAPRYRLVGVVEQALRDVDVGAYQVDGR